MAKLLRLEEMIDCAFLMEADGPLRDKADALAGQLEALGTELAKAPAERLGVDTGPAVFDHSEMGGVCAPFYARSVGHICPEPLPYFDEDEWTTEDGTELKPGTGDEL